METFLKLGRIGCKVVVSLPMRDGNFLNTVQYKIPARGVVSLPMRDGNHGYRDCSPKSGQVVSLPMRDGNDPCKLLRSALFRLLAYL